MNASPPNAPLPTDPAAKPPVAPLPVGRTLADAWRTFVHAGPAILARCWPALLVCAAVQAAGVRIQWEVLRPGALEAIAAGTQPVLPSWFAFLWPLSMLGYLALLVAVQRTVLLPDERAGRGPYLFPARAAWRSAKALLRMALASVGVVLAAYVAFAVGAVLVAVGSGVVLAAAGWTPAPSDVPVDPAAVGPTTTALLASLAAATVVALPVVWLWARCSVLLPAAALGEGPVRIREAFAATRGRARALSILIGAPLVPTYAGSALALAPMYLGHEVASAVLAPVLILPCLVFQVVAMAVCYRRLRDGHAPAAPSPIAADALPA